MKRFLLIIWLRPIDISSISKQTANFNNSMPAIREYMNIIKEYGFHKIFLQYVIIINENNPFLKNSHCKSCRRLKRKESDTKPGSASFVSGFKQTRKGNFYETSNRSHIIYRGSERGSYKKIFRFPFVIIVNTGNYRKPHQQHPTSRLVRGLQKLGLVSQNISHLRPETDQKPLRDEKNKQKILSSFWCFKL